LHTLISIIYSNLSKRFNISVVNNDSAIARICGIYRFATLLGYFADNNTFLIITFQLFPYVALPFGIFFI